MDKNCGNYKKETNNADSLYKSKERYIINGLPEAIYNKVESFAFSKDCQNYIYAAVNYKLFKGTTNYIVTTNGILFETKEYEFDYVPKIGFAKGKTLYAIMKHKKKDEYLFFQENGYITYDFLRPLVGGFLNETNNNDIIIYASKKSKDYLIINNKIISLDSSGFFPVVLSEGIVSEDKNSYMIFLTKLLNDKLINKCIFNDELILFRDLPFKGDLSILEKTTNYSAIGLKNKIKIRFSSYGDWALYIDGITYYNGNISNEKFDDIDLFAKAPFYLYVKSIDSKIPIEKDRKIYLSELTGDQSDDELIARIEPHPKKNGAFIIRNLSDRSWKYKVEDKQYTIEPQQARALIPNGIIEINGIEVQVTKES
jgi:hypothetical protein